MGRQSGRRWFGGRGILFGMLLVGLLAAVSGTRAAPAAQGGSLNIYGVSTMNRLVRFTSAAPNVILANQAITGLPSGEQVLGIDFRPDDPGGPLFGLGSSSRLYTIDRNTAAANQVGTGVFTTTLVGTQFGFDFNPVPDKIRVVSNREQNLRLNPVVPPQNRIFSVDSKLKYATGDPNFRKNPDIVGAAYTNPTPDATTTVNYAIDSNQNTLVTQGKPASPPDPAVSPNTGLLFTRGSLGVMTSGLVGFDISTDNRAFAAITVAPVSSNLSDLYSIDLTTGAATMIGEIRMTGRIRGIAIELAPATP